jgi:hypothetical protein
VSAQDFFESERWNVPVGAENEMESYLQNQSMLHHAQKEAYLALSQEASQIDLP